MRSHPSAERWDDLAAGRVDEDARRELVAHAEGCAACREARQRVEAARGTLASLRRADAPELPWEGLGARIKWTLSSEQRRLERAREHRSRSVVGRLGRRLGGLLGGRAGLPILATCATVAVAWFAIDSLVGRGSPTPSTGAPAEARSIHGSPPGVVAATSATAAAPAEGVVMLRAGEATLDGRPLTMADVIRPGARLAAQGGRLAVQLGRRTGILLEAGATVEVVALDDQTVELRSTGVVSVEVEPRQPAQRFAITVAGRRVEVRGTVFRVAETRGALDVAVSRGRVAVHDGDDSVEVPAGSRLSLLAGQRPRGAFLAALPELEAATLGDVGRVALLPVWDDASSARLRNGVLAVAAPPRVRVRVDGVETGAGRLEVRTSPGRHLVEVGVKGRWVEVGVGTATQADFAGVSVSASSARPRELEAELEAHRASLEGCGDRLRKVDPLFEGDIVVEIGIHGDGSVEFVSAVKGLADRDVEACVLGVVRDRFSFPAGDAATLRKKISF
jgi:hypothetical protein